MGKAMLTPTMEHLVYKKTGDDRPGSSSRSRSCFTSKRSSIDSYSENSWIIDSIISCGFWVFLSNRIVSYWPFYQKSSLNYGHHKFLGFQLPTLGVFFSLLYISLNIFYVAHYFCFKIAEDAELFEPFDLILITIWDLMVIVSVAAHRLYGMFNLANFHTFWDEIVSVVTQITRISSEKETREKFRVLRRWTFKWFAVFFILGLIDCSAVIYHYTFVSKDNLLTTLLFEYLEIVICMHNSSALMLIFFIKIITYGFTACKTKLIELSVTLPFEYELVTVTQRKFHHDNHQNDSLNRTSSVLYQVLKLIHDLESCVSRFNKLFAFSLLLEAVLSFWQVMFSMYFLHITSVENFAFAVNMAVPIITYPLCLMSLCKTASTLSVECKEMVAIFQQLPLSVISQQDAQKIQILVARLSSGPPVIQVFQIFLIRESLLGSAFNALATYFIVLVQMRQISRSA